MNTTVHILMGILLANSAAGQTVSSQTVNSTGDSHRKGNVRLEWNVGEMSLVNTLTASNSSNIITNGLLQSKLESQKSLYASPAFSDDEVSILPNPTYGQLRVKINVRQQGRIMIRVYDQLSKLKYVKRFYTNGNAQTEQINMSGYIRGSYMMHIELAPIGGPIVKNGLYKIVKIDR